MDILWDVLCQTICWWSSAVWRQWNNMKLSDVHKTVTLWMTVVLWQRVYSACTVHAVALHSTYWHSLVRLLVVYYLLNAMYALAYLKYSWHKLLNIGSKAECCIINQTDMTSRQSSSYHRGPCGFQLRSDRGSVEVPPSNAKPPLYECKIACQQDQGAGTHYIHTEKHPGLLCYSNHRYVAQPKHPGGGCWASRAHSTPIWKDIWLQ